jgi:hypothetical protein
MHRLRPVERNKSMLQYNSPWTWRRGKMKEMHRMKSYGGGGAKEKSEGRVRLVRALRGGLVRRRALSRSWLRPRSIESSNGVAYGRVAADIGEEVAVGDLRGGEGDISRILEVPPKSMLLPLGKLELPVIVPGEGLAKAGSEERLLAAESIRPRAKLSIVLRRTLRWG